MRLPERLAGLRLDQALVAATGRGVAIGGTSAGAVSLGEAAFDALEGSVTSEEALADPLRSEVSPSYPIWSQPELARSYVDSHFMDRGREGRLLVPRGDDRVEPGDAVVAVAATEHARRLSAILSG